MAPTNESFASAENDWNLEKLYQDLAVAKQRLSGKRKPLSLVEMACLRGLLCGCGPVEIAAELKREPRGLRVDLSRGLYRYVETLTERPLNALKDWREVTDWLEQAGYKTSLSPVSLPVNDSLIKIVDVSLVGESNAPVIDLKVRNVGSQVAFLKTAKFLFYNAWTIKSWIVLEPAKPAAPRSEMAVPGRAGLEIPRSRAVTPSYDYQVALPTFFHLNVDLPFLTEESFLDVNAESVENPSHFQEFKISQCVAANDVDRFTFTFSVPKTSQQLLSDRGLSYLIHTSYIYHFKLELIYDENDKNIQSSKLILWVDFYTYKSGENRYFFEESCLDYHSIDLPQEILEYSDRNKAVFSLLSQIEAIKSSSLNQIIQNTPHLTKYQKLLPQADKPTSPALLSRLFKKKS